MLGNAAVAYCTRNVTNKVFVFDLIIGFALVK